jgi:TPR repeat protein
MRRPSRGKLGAVLIRRRTTRLSAVAARLVVLGASAAGLAPLAGCRHQGSAAVRSWPSRDCEPFADVDRILHDNRPALCQDLGRAVPAKGETAAAKSSSEQTDTSNTAAVEAGCAANDPVACFWAANWSDRGFQVEGPGKWTRIPKDRERAIRLFRRSCDGGYDDGCLWLAALLHDVGPRTEYLQLVTSICTGDRTNACASIAGGIPGAEQPPALAAGVARTRATLARSCLAGHAEDCMTRWRMDSGDDAAAPQQIVWLTEACKHGSPDGCMQAKLAGSAIDEVRAIVARACGGGNPCRGLLGSLRQSCAAGNAAACYLTANACTRDEAIPHKIACHPPAPQRCGVAEEPPTAPASCLPRRIRGRLLVDEGAAGDVMRWRAYELCDQGKRVGYLLEHAGPKQASTQEVHDLLNRHRATLGALGANSSGFGAGGLTGFCQGEVRLDDVLPIAKIAFAEVPQDSCFGVALWTNVGRETDL